MSGAGLLLVALAAGLTMAANLLLRAGIDAAGGFAPGGIAGLVPALARLFLQPLFDIGFVAYFLASVVWFQVVATEPLSTAYPVLVGLTFTFVTVGAVVIFGESLDLRKVLGLATILGGILLVSFGRSTS